MSGVIEPLLSDERGQTLQDYVVGISVFLIVVLFGIGFFPDLLVAVEGDVGTVQEAKAEGIARQIVTETSVPGTTNELDVGVLWNDVLSKSEAQLRTKYALNQSESINITVQTLDGSSFVSGGPAGTRLTTDSEYYGGPAGSTDRIVTLSDGSCPTACRLVVRVWQ